MYAMVFGRTAALLLSGRVYVCVCVTQTQPLHQELRSVTREHSWKPTSKALEGSNHCTVDMACVASGPTPLTLDGAAVRKSWCLRNPQPQQ
eukprot:147211-Amphidinium_carterae.2